MTSYFNPGRFLDSLKLSPWTPSEHDSVDLTLDSSPVGQGECIMSLKKILVQADMGIEFFTICIPTTSLIGIT